MTVATAAGMDGNREPARDVRIEAVFRFAISRHGNGRIVTMQVELHCRVGVEVKRYRVALVHPQGGLALGKRAGIPVQVEYRVRTQRRMFMGSKSRACKQRGQQQENSQHVFSSIGSQKFDSNETDSKPVPHVPPSEFKSSGGTMKTTFISTLACAFTLLFGSSAQASILGMMNYESMPAESLRTLKLGDDLERREGIAIIELDPEEENFGQILWEMPLNPEWVAHHIFYNPSQTKAYLAFLGGGRYGVMDLTANPYQVEFHDLPGCEVGEDIIFPTDDDKWYLTCMGSDNVFVGDADSDEIIAEIRTSRPWPHGFDIDNRIDRALVTSSNNVANPSEFGDYLSVVKPSTNESIGDIRISEEGSATPAGPVEILFVPGSEPALAYVTNMITSDIWAVTWNADTESFDAEEVFDLTTVGGALPLEMYLTDDNTRMYVTTAKSGMLHSFDISNLMEPKHLKTIKTGGGAHHVAIDKAGNYLFVQNSFVNLPGMHEGTVTVVDRDTMEVVRQMTTLRDRGLTPNSIVLLPQWNDLAGH